MPWDNQNGGGWQGGGGGNRGPWGQGPSGGGGNQPPDLDELIRRAQEKFRQVFSGGGGAPGGGTGTGTGGGRGPIFLVAIVIIGFLAYSSFFRVNANEKGIVLRFGEHVRTAEPGLHFKFPYPVETVLTPAVTNISSVDIGMRSSGGSPITVPEESLMLTGDENIVDISFSVQWRIKAEEAAKYLFNVENPDLAVKAVAESMMREAVGASRIEVLQTTGRNEVQNQVREGLQKTLNEYGAGIEITEVKLQKVDPPAQVLDAFRDVQAARADQERLRNQAETYANTIIPRARGEAEKIKQAAEAYREQIVAEAEGEAQRFVSIYNEYRKAEDVTRRRIYIETMQDVLGGTNKVIMNDGKGGQSVLPYLPLNELKPRGGSSTSSSGGSSADGNQTSTGGR
ncbi:FtsH protease activity modulator HflK [Parvibaculum sp.]|jgi:membrane protease subunit HflK|uniref:FtsH protease activity modulator HflK n=1 Tax=Parvibaculum sp. TaxID=2024848 RepID=UPI001B145E6F|nr:FtsH protease activity modulator HflK [Parvibaculum sp.]MBO6635641.1 FtsH protease activity modulator HflK [Parvibaculum sp.]MBO6679780.1 FtsH protease activity modulator HflK [Parvibaculum sp.]MBO6685840.1 FtsH protease activity modulator HflK [Parvibaculum sp.]MBO6904062.1 FtsH protease activity modulator HflK [Parvibaculum sp.]